MVTEGLPSWPARMSAIAAAAPGNCCVWRIDQGLSSRPRCADCGGVRRLGLGAISRPMRLRLNDLPARAAAPTSRWPRRLCHPPRPPRCFRGHPRRRSPPCLPAGVGQRTPYRRLPQPRPRRPADVGGRRCTSIVWEAVEDCLLCSATASRSCRTNAARSSQARLQTAGSTCSCTRAGRRQLDDPVRPTEPTASCLMRKAAPAMGSGALVESIDRLRKRLV